MTVTGFEKFIKFMEGAFQTSLETKHRDAYWELLRDCSDDEIVLAAKDCARGWVQKIRAPLAADILNHVDRTRRSAQQRRRPETTREGALSRAELGAVLAELRRLKPFRDRK